MNLKMLILLITLNRAFLSVIIDVLTRKSVNYVTHLTCNSVFQQIAQQKEMINSNFLSKFTEVKRSKPPYFKTAVIIDASCPNWSQFLDEKTHYNNPKSWLIITTNLSETQSVIFNYPFEVDSDLTVVLKVSQIYYQLYEVYNSGFHTNGRLCTRNIGFWKNGSMYMGYKKRMDMAGVVLKCMVVITQPIHGETFEEYLDRSRVGSDDSVHKLKYFTLLKYLRDMYNFSYKLYRTNSWGYNQNGTFDGMSGELQRKQIDVGGSPVFMRADRARFLDYTTHTWESRPCFIFRHPKRLGSFYSIYTRPLEEHVWYCTSGVIIVFTVALCCMLRCTRVAPNDDMDESWSIVVLTIFGAISQQGTYINRRSTSVRFTIYVIFLFNLILYQFYNASIVGSLLMEAPKNIRNLEDLLKSPLKVGVENVLYNLDYFKRTTDPIAKQLYNTKIINSHRNNILTPTEGMALVKQGGYAFHIDSTTAYKIIRETFSDRETCELQEIQLYPPQRMIAVVRKGLPYRELMTHGMRKMTEAGLMKRLKMTWEEPKPKCINKPDSSVFAVNIHDFAMALLVLLVGYIISLTILLFEIVVAKRVENKVIISFRH